MDWLSYKTVTDIKAFIGICVYYRVWIKGFSLIAEPRFRFTSKNREFLWTEAQEDTLDDGTRVLRRAPALKPIDYEGSGLVILFVDPFLEGWGAVLQQDKPNMRKRQPAHYESGMWTDAEKKYNSRKLECRELLKAHKNFRYYLYGDRFLFEIDNRMLVQQLNQPASDLPESVVNG